MVQNRRRAARRSLPELLAHPDLFDGGEGEACAETSTPAEKKLRVGEAWTSAFADWSQEMQDEGTLKSQGSIRAYAELWEALAEWAVLTQAPAIGPDELSVEDLRLYVDSRVGRGDAHARISPRHAWRLLTLIDRVLIHRAKSTGEPPNRSAYQLLQANEHWRWAQTAANEPPIERLSGAHARKLVDYLQQAALPRNGNRSAMRTWKQVRDAAAVAMHLGAGLTPLEVRELRVEDVNVAVGTRQVSRVVVRGHGQTPLREVPMARWAARLLSHWKRVRTDQGIQGEWMFPSTGKGTQWGKGAQNLAVERVIEAARLPIEVQEGGCFRLRHTFALRQLERGTSLEEVGLLLGLRDEGALQRYRSVRLGRAEVI